MSPSCCQESKDNRTVTLFVPVTKHFLPSWTVPFRDDSGRLVADSAADVKFCPFCGKKLTKEHLEFSE